MAIVHKVIILNTPFKLFGFSIIQGIVLLGTALLGMWIGFSMPPVKFNGIPLGFWVFIVIFCGGMVFVHASAIKPWQWWRNRILSLANLLPTKVMPQPQNAKTYIEEDNSIKKRISGSPFSSSNPSSIFPK